MHQKPVCRQPWFHPDDWFPTQDDSIERIDEVKRRCLGCPVFDACKKIPAAHGIFAGELRGLCDARF